MMRQIKRWLYAALGAIVIATYANVAWRGLELPTTKKSMAPQGMRGAHGGSRTFWVGGYRGGK